MSLAAQKPQNFSMVVFYHGLHCPVCRRYASELNGMIGEFDKRGVSTVITSTDTHFDEMGQAIDFVLGKNYPAQGEA